VKIENFHHFPSSRSFATLFNWQFRWKSGARGFSATTRRRKGSEKKKKISDDPSPKRWRSSVEKIFPYSTRFFYHFFFFRFFLSILGTLLTVVALGLFGQLCLVHIVLALSHCVEAFSVKLIHRKNYLNAPGTCGVDFACCLLLLIRRLLFFSTSRAV